MTIPQPLTAPHHAGLWINGREQSALSGETFPVLAPATESVIGYAARATAPDVDQAVSTAQRGFMAWSALPPADRERALLRAADLLEAHAPALTDLLIDESGSTAAKAQFEFSYGANLLRTAAGEVRRLYGDTFPNDKPGRLSLVIREPLGVVAAISPFNAPLVLLIKMIAFPLAAGNAVIAKPSEETPLIGVALGRILSEAGLPDGTFNVLTGYGGEVGSPLVEHPGVAGIAFTGSTSVGQRIGVAAMATMKRLQLELGGKNPLLILRDVDPLKAARIAAQGAYYHAGQICMSSSRLIVERPIAADFVAAFREVAAGLQIGDLRDPNTFYGPLINRRALEKVERHVATARAGGATVITGGEGIGGLVYRPTLLANVPPDVPASCEETFGPVATLTIVEDVEAAIQAANSTPFGLSAGILTENMTAGISAARRIRSGAVHLGMHSFQSDALAPVGGFGLSGMGRSGGKYSIEHFTELKWISVALDG